MKQRTFCPECGPDIEHDEDGCCVTCGAQATGRFACAANLALETNSAHLRTIADLRARLKVLKKVLRNVLVLANSYYPEDRMVVAALDLNNKKWRKA